eukprot:3282799-Amphidinium_carterae.1
MSAAIYILLRLYHDQITRKKTCQRHSVRLRRRALQEQAKCETVKLIHLLHQPIPLDLALATIERQEECMLHGRFGLNFEEAGFWSGCTT